MGAGAKVHILGVFISIVTPQLLVAHDNVPGTINTMAPEIIIVRHKVIPGRLVTPGDPKTVYHLEIHPGQANGPGRVAEIIDRKIDKTQVVQDLSLFRTQPAAVLGAGQGHRPGPASKKPAEHVDSIGNVPASVTVNISIIISFGSATGQGGKLVGDDAKQRCIEYQRK